MKIMDTLAFPVMNKHTKRLHMAHMRNIFGRVVLYFKKTKYPSVSVSVSVSLSLSLSLSQQDRCNTMPFLLHFCFFMFAVTDILRL